MKKSRSYFKSCDTLPIFNFYQILNTSDLSWLVKGHDADSDPIQFTETETAELNHYWFNITNRYNEMFGEKTGNTRFVVLAQIAELAQEVDIVSTLLNYYHIRKSESIKNALSEWNYDADDMEKCEKKIKGITFRINMMKSKNKDLFPTEAEEVEKKQYDLFNDVVLLENSLGNGTSVDVHTTCVTKWVKMILYNDQKNREIKQRLNKDGRSN